VVTMGWHDGKDRIGDEKGFPFRFSTNNSF